MLPVSSRDFFQMECIRSQHTGSTESGWFYEKYKVNAIFVVLINWKLQYPHFGYVKLWLILQWVNNHFQACFPLYSQLSITWFRYYERTELPKIYLNQTIKIDAAYFVTDIIDYSIRFIFDIRHFLGDIVEAFGVWLK